MVNSSNTLKHLSVSIVTYAPDLDELSSTLAYLRREIEGAITAELLSQATVYIVDNGPGDAWRDPLESLVYDVGAESSNVSDVVISGHGNIGFGQGHNLAIQRSRAGAHLVLNPDVWIEPGSLSAGLRFLSENPGVVLLSPSATWPDGMRQYLCKNYPAVLDFMLRGFAPQWLQDLCKVRIARYEARHLQAGTVADVPIASGCFMLARRRALVDVGGFSPQYFMYFEDFDLSLRLGRIGRIVYHPGVRIIHAGGHAARKGRGHILMFGRSALTFFNTHGWKLF